MKWQSVFVGLGFLGVLTVQEFLPTYPSVAAFEAASLQKLEDSLTPEGWAYLAERAERLQKKLEARPSITVLKEYGISSENDTYEQAGKTGRIAPNVGYARALREGEFLNIAVDPAVALPVHTALEADLSRSPTQEEVAARIAKKDAQIRGLNQKMSERHNELAKIYQEREKFPKELIVDLARSVMEESTIPSPYETENRKLDPAERLTSEWKLVQQLINDLARQR